jgi:hypothetical protein
MNKETKLLLALSQVQGISKLIQDNEHEHYLNTFLVPIHTELKRQLTNHKHSIKIEE